MSTFEFVANRQLVCGKDSIGKLPFILGPYKIHKVFLITFSKDVSFIKRIQNDLRANNFEYVVFDEIVGEPDLDIIDRAVDLCVREKADCVVAVGGGSVIDAAKTVAMIATNGGKTVEYQLEGKEVIKAPLLFVAIPTTAGTGAEATRVSVVYNEEKGYKKSIYDNSMIAQVVILDPETTKFLPKNIVAATGIDALTHAIESYTSVFASPITRMYSLKALEIISQNIIKAYNNPEDEDARTNMLFGSYLAGCAITAGTCLAHIVGQPIGAIFKIPHGNACSLFLVPSMKLNLDYALEDYATIALVLGANDVDNDKKALAQKGFELLEQIILAVGLDVKLSDYVPMQKIDIKYILDNIQTSMGHIKTNPRKVDRALFEELIKMAL